METSTTQVDLSQNLADAIATLSSSPSVGDTRTPIENVAEDEETVENPFGKKKRKRTSKVWNEFKEVVLLDGTKKGGES